MEVWECGSVFGLIKYLLEIVISRITLPYFHSPILSHFLPYPSKINENTIILDFNLSIVLEYMRLGSL